MTRITPSGPARARPLGVVTPTGPTTWVTLVSSHTTTVGRQTCADVPFRHIPEHGGWFQVRVVAHAALVAGEAAGARCPRIGFEVMRKHLW